MDFCGKCGDAVAVGKKKAVLQCSNCKKCFHGKCITPFESDLRILMELSVTLRSTWLCGDCENLLKSLMGSHSTTSNDSSMDAVAVIKEFRHDLIEKLAIFDSLPVQLNQLLKKVDEFSIEMGAFRADLEASRSERAIIEERMAALENRDAHDNCLPNDRKEIEISVEKMIIPSGKKFDAVIDIIRSSLGVPVQLTDIDNCFVVKKKPKPVSDIGCRASSDNDNTPTSSSISLVVRLISERVRDDIMTAWREKRDDSGVIYTEKSTHQQLIVMFRERVPPRVWSVFNAARDFAKRRGFDYVWIRRARVFLRRKEKESAFIINTIDDLKQIE